jgi:hypothetical protein
MSLTALISTPLSISISSTITASNDFGSLATLSVMSVPIAPGDSATLALPMSGLPKPITLNPNGPGCELTVSSGQRVFNAGPYPVTLNRLLLPAGSTIIVA